MPNTYTELRKTTVGTATNSITFDLTGISGYTDLVLVGNFVQSASTAFGSLSLRFNGDTTSNYSYTGLQGSGSGSGSSFRAANSTQMDMASQNVIGDQNIIIQIQNYSNATTFKTAISRYNNPNGLVMSYVGLWRKTPEPITSITFFPASQNFAVGSTFSLYGIANADQGAAKATGGIITEDSQYWYHTFGASGAFIPKQSLTCDVLVVAGGGSGGNDYYGGGGGAGGLRALTSQSLTAISHAVTIGGGGSGGSLTNGNSGSNSSFIGGLISISATGGGWGSIFGTGTAGSGGSGGGGQGATGPFNGGAGNAGSYSPVEGFAGGLGLGTNTQGAGGGGSAAVGTNGSAGGAGGVGTTSALINTMGSATSTGQLSGGNYYYAGGGGGGNNAGAVPTGGLGGGGRGEVAFTGAGGNPIAGTANTGGGGGGGRVSVAGGSGVVIVRYLKA
jgi:hypothetical protein